MWQAIEVYVWHQRCGPELGLDICQLHAIQLDWFWKKLKTKFQSKHRGRLGPALSDEKRIRILNRIGEWGSQGIFYEGDQRHVEICLEELGLDESSREVSTPCDKSLENVKNTNAIKNKEKEEKKLEPVRATRYRGMVARMNYPGHDRSDIQFAAKELGKEMSSPSENS